jgi:hypothetical protein
MNIPEQMSFAHPFPPSACHITCSKNLLAVGAQSLRAGAVSAGAWGLRSALISVSGWVGGMAGVALLGLYREAFPHESSESDFPGNDHILAAAQAGGMCVGKTIGVLFGGAFLGAAQTLGERACAEARLYCGRGLEYDVAAPNGPRPAQLVTTGAFCTNGLLRGYVEPLIAEWIPDVPPIVRTMALDVFLSGATSSLSQCLVSTYDARPDQPNDVRLSRVQRRPALDAVKIRLGFRTVLLGLPFDVLPSAARAVAHSLGMPESQGQDLVDAADGICSVAGTLVRLNTWFHYREKPRAGDESAAPSSSLAQCALSTIS